MRSQTVQFGYFTREEAAAMLETMPQTGDTIGDRIALRRRRDYPVPAPAPIRLEALKK